MRGWILSPLEEHPGKDNVRGLRGRGRGQHLAEQQDDQPPAVLANHVAPRGHLHEKTDRLLEEMLGRFASRSPSRGSYCESWQSSSASYAVLSVPGSGRRIASVVPAAVSVVISCDSEPFTLTSHFHARVVVWIAPDFSGTT